MNRTTVSVPDCFETRAEELKEMKRLLVEERKIVLLRGVPGAGMDHLVGCYAFENFERERVFYCEAIPHLETGMLQRLGERYGISAGKREDGTAFHRLLVGLGRDEEGGLLIVGVVYAAALEKLAPLLGQWQIIGTSYDQDQPSSRLAVIPVTGSPVAWNQFKADRAREIAEIGPENFTEACRGNLLVARLLTGNWDILAGVRSALSLWPKEGPTEESILYRLTELTKAFFEHNGSEEEEEFLLQLLSDQVACYWTIEELEGICEGNLKRSVVQVLEELYQRGWLEKSLLTEDKVVYRMHYLVRLALKRAVLIP